MSGEGFDDELGHPRTAGHSGERLNKRLEKLLTTIPVETCEAAEAIIGWYCARWEIEIFFRVLKQGCQVEELRLEADRRLLNCIGIP